MSVNTEFDAILLLRNDFIFKGVPLTKEQTAEVCKHILVPNERSGRDLALSCYAQHEGKKYMGETVFHALCQKYGMKEFVYRYMDLCYELTGPGHGGPFLERLQNWLDQIPQEFAYRNRHLLAEASNHAAKECRIVEKHALVMDQRPRDSETEADAKKRSTKFHKNQLVRFHKAEKGVSKWLTQVTRRGLEQKLAGQTQQQTH